MDSAEIFWYVALYLALSPKSKFKSFQDLGQDYYKSKRESLWRNQSSADKEVKIIYYYNSLPFFFFFFPANLHFPSQFVHFIPINQAEREYMLYFRVWHLLFFCSKLFTVPCNFCPVQRTQLVGVAWCIMCLGILSHDVRLETLWKCLHF